MILNEADLKVLLTVPHRNQEVSDIKFSPGRTSAKYCNWNICLLLL